MEDSQAHEQLVGFLDILGTKALVADGRFDNCLALDFANAACLAARAHPKIRMHVYSDSVVLSAAKDDFVQFLDAIQEMFLNWYSDRIMVRGAIAFGEMVWVDFSEDKKFFKNISNVTFSRFYGKALVEAVGLEKDSGPGMVCFLTERAVDILEEYAGQRILSKEGGPCLFNWVPQEKHQIVKVYCDSFLATTGISPERRRHLEATMKFLELPPPGRG